MPVQRLVLYRGERIVIIFRLVGGSAKDASTVLQSPLTLQFFIVFRPVIAKAPYESQILKALDTILSQSTYQWRRARRRPYAAIVIPLFFVLQFSDLFLHLLVLDTLRIDPLLE